MRGLARIVCTVIMSVAPPATGQLSADLRSAVNRASLGAEGLVGVAVFDAVSGEPIFEHNGRMPLAPASNQKLLTSAAAMKILGPGFAFRTEMFATPEGDLVLVGSGDPCLADPEVLRDLDPPTDAETVLRAFAAAVAERAPTPRELILDDRVFDRELIHPDWPTDQLDRWYCAPVQGLSVHSNVIAFYPTPGDGSSPTASVEPESPWIEIVNQAEVIAEGRNAVWIQQSETDDRFILRGKIRTRSQAPIEVALKQPSLMLGRLIADRMSSAGAAFTASPPVRLIGEHERPDTQETPLAAWVTPIDDVLYRCNYDSMNLCAEALLKRVGHAVTGERGSWSSGAAVIRMLISDTLGPAAAADTVIRDGSGLSRENRVTADTLAQFLAAMYADDEVRAMYLRTLPTGTGKLADRLETGALTHALHAKTGTINRVRCLSGYIVDESTGQTAAFSILCNGLTTGESVRAAYRLQSEIVSTIDRRLSELTIPEPAGELDPAFGG